MKASISITLRPGILDCQGKAIEGALKSLGIDGIISVRQGKLYEIELVEGTDPTSIETAAGVLANPVMEVYRIEIA